MQEQKENSGGGLAVLGGVFKNRNAKPFKLLSRKFRKTQPICYISIHSAFPAAVGYCEGDDYDNSSDK